MHSRGEAGFLKAPVMWLQIDGGEIRDTTQPDFPNETAYVLSLRSSGVRPSPAMPLTLLGWGLGV